MWLHDASLVGLYLTVAGMYLPDRDPERPCQTAVELHFELGLLAFGRQPYVDRALHLLHLRLDHLGGRRQ